MLSILTALMFVISGLITPYMVESSSYVSPHEPKIKTIPDNQNCFTDDEGEVLDGGIWGGASLAPIDYDNDGDVDIIEGGDLFIYMLTNEDNGKRFQKTVIDMLTYDPRGDNLAFGGIASADFNNDGWEDFVTGGVYGLVRLFINNGSQPGKPRFDNYSLFKFGQAAWGVTAADFNHDGLMDFAVSWATRPLNYSRITIFYNQGNLNFTRKDVYQLDMNYITGLNAGDFDNDGDIDIIFTISIYTWHGKWPLNVMGAYFLLKNKGDDSFEPPRLIAERGHDLYIYLGIDFYLLVQSHIRHYLGLNRFNPHITSADYDMDGDLDFLIGDNSGMVEFFLNNGEGSFTSAGVIHRYGHLSWGLASVDFDKDGDIDFLVVALKRYNDLESGFLWLKLNQIIPSPGKLNRESEDTLGGYPRWSIDSQNTHRIFRENYVGI